MSISHKATANLMIKTRDFRNNIQINTPIFLNYALKCGNTCTNITLESYKRKKNQNLSYNYIVMI